MKINTENRKAVIKDAGTRKSQRGVLPPSTSLNSGFCAFREVKMEKISVSTDTLRRVLEALSGPPHLIRELQATRGPLVGDDNPINLLIKEYNEQIKN